jgi:4-hydroxy-2-oxoheptanedioate aldolase
MPHVEVQSAIADAIKRVCACGNASGIFVGEADGRRMLDLGARFVAVEADVSLLRTGADGFAARFKA